MLKKICEISASSWFYYKEICYDARSHERKIRLVKSEIYHLAAYTPFHGAYIETQLYLLLYAILFFCEFQDGGHTTTIECRPIQICVMIETYKSKVKLQ